MRIITAEQLVVDQGPASEAIDARCPFAVRVQIAGVTMELKTDRNDLVERFVQYYTDHVSAADPDFAFYVYADGDGYVFASPNRSTYRWNDGPISVDSLAFLTDAAAMSALIDRDPELASMHAAAIERNGVAAAIAGDSTAGKTTTLLACARRGLRVYSDERALLRGTVVQPFLRTCSVREDGARRLFAERGDDRLGTLLRRGGRISLRACFGDNAIAEPAPLGAVYIIGGYAEEPAIERVTTFEALPAIGKWFYKRGTRFERLSGALELLMEIPTYRLTLGTPRATADALASHLRKP
jgi:hypothetical protein